MQTSRCPELFSPFVQFVVRLSFRFSSAGHGRMPRHRKRGGWKDGDLRDGEAGFFRDGAAPTGGGHARGKFFPIVGKRPKNFSNHWKIRPNFSNHWKKIFQSLENFSVADGAADRAPPGRFQRKRGTDSPELAGTGRGFSVSFHPKMDSMHSSRKTTGPTSPPEGAVGCRQLWGSPFPWGQAVRKHGNFQMKTPLERENSKNGILELSLS